MTGCEFDNLVEKYVNMGWYKMTDVFNKQRIGKEKTLKKDVDENLLALFGAIRTYIVNESYDKYKTSGQIMIRSGSTGITSDYDVNIVGKDSENTMQKMFNDFLEKYKHSMSYSFDTNIYVHGFYIYDRQSFPLHKFKLKGSTTFFVPKFDPKDKDVAYSFACIKLVETQRDFYKFKNLDKYVKLGRSIDDDLKKIYKQKFDSVRNVADKEMVTRYALYYEYSKILNNLMYVEDSTFNFQFISNVAKYFSIESYYTQCTFNVIVLNLLESTGLKLDKIEYICAAIENLGDFVHHFKQENIKTEAEFELKLIKYSKYIYRIYFSLYHAHTLFKRYELKTRMNEIRKHVMKYRDSADREKINFMLLDYNSRNRDNYLQHMIDKIGSLINELVD
jgi:hypothetical protein